VEFTLSLRTAYSVVNVYLPQFLIKLPCKALGLHGKGAPHDRNLTPHTKNS